MNRSWGMNGMRTDALTVGNCRVPSMYVGEKVMMRLSTLRRWTVRCLRVSVLLAGLGLGGTAMAQAPAAGQLPKMTYTKNTIFHLPVQMDERTRANVREICLYVKSGSGDWVRQETGLPSMTQFNYKVPRDGEYWFSLVTIDKAGRMTPADVSQEPPGLRVMVDTQPPSLMSRPGPAPKENSACAAKCRTPTPTPRASRPAITIRPATTWSRRLRALRVFSRSWAATC